MGPPPTPSSSSTPSRPAFLARFLDASPYALAFLVALAVGVTTTVTLRDELIRFGTKHADAYGARARATIVAAVAPRRAGPEVPVEDTRECDGGEEVGSTRDGAVRTRVSNGFAPVWRMRL
jgi:hypothetical protein